MKKNNYVLTTAIILIFSITLYAQDKVVFSLEDYSKTINVDKDESVSMLIQGDVSQIILLLEEVGGTFKYSSGNIVAAQLSQNQLNLILDSKAIIRIQAYPSKLKPFSDSVLCNNNVTPIHNSEAPLPMAYDGTGVIVGIFDDGIDFNHPDLQDAFGDTRILWLWDMTKGVAANTPAPYGYGQEWSNTEIDAGSSTHVPFNSLDIHGTHVTSLAVGNGLATGGFQGTAPKADIIYVAGLATGTASDAVDYIYTKAAALGRPCVINISAGTDYGLHDGNDLESQLIDSLILARPGQALVAAAGNSGQTGAVHLSYTTSSTDTNFTFFAPAADGLVLMRIVADSNDIKGIDFAVGADKMSPVHSFRGNTPFVNIGTMPIATNITTPLMNGGNQIGTLYSYLDTINGVWDISYGIVPDSTTYYWRLMAKGTGNFDLWNYKNSDKSFVPIINSGLPSLATMPDSMNYKMPDSDKTIAATFQCLDNVIAVTSYINRNSYTDCNNNTYTDGSLTVGEREASSSIGPTRDGRTKPDIAAPGGMAIGAVPLAFSSALAGSADAYKLAQGCKHYREFKTSFAAPSITGIVALYLQKNPTATVTQIKQAIIDSGVEDSYTGTGLPNNEWGYGKVDGFAALTGIVDTVSAPSDSLICENSAAIFVVNATGNSLAYQWQEDSGSGFVDLTNTPPYGNVTTDTLTISSASSSMNGNNYRCEIINARACKNVFSQAASLTVASLPSVTLVGLDANYCLDDGQVTLTGSPDGGTYNGSGITDTVNGIFDPSTTMVGIQTVVYTFADNNDCQSSVSKSTNVEDCDTVTSIESVVASNDINRLTARILTPNGDGLDDTFTFSSDKSNHAYSEKGSLIIHNTWGGKVFESANPFEVWDGTTIGGEALPSGNYYFIAQLDGEVYRGIILLLH